MSDDTPATADPAISPYSRPGGLFFGVDAEGMPPWIPYLLRRIAFLVVAGAVIFALVRELRGFIVLLIISLFLSTALEPGVSYLARRGWRRGIATGLLFVVFGTVFGGFVAMMIPLVIDQTAALVDKLPSYIDQTSEFVGRFGIDFSQQRIQEAIASIDTSLQALATRVAGGVFGVGSRLVSTVIQGLTIGLFTFYLTADGPRFRRTVLSVLRPDRQREVLRILEIAIEKTGGYFYSRSLLAAIAGTATWGALKIIGVPFALPLAVWVGVLSQFVPVVGTYLGGILPVLIALLESPGRALVVVIFFIVYQQIENYLLSPHITARTMSMHPAVAFGSAIIGGTLLGAPGAIMALPVAATVQAFVSTYLERHALVESHLLNEPVEADDADSKKSRRKGGMAQGGAV